MSFRPSEASGEIYQKKHSCYLTVKPLVNWLIFIAVRPALANFEIVVVSNQANEDNFSETKQEAERTLAAIGALMREYEAHKSFYPEEIYESMLELQKLSWFQFVLQADRGNVMERNTAFKTAVDVLRKKSQSSDADGTSETIDKIYEAIRKRVQYWEDLQIT